MELTPFHQSLLLTIVFLAATIAGIGYVTIPDDPPWPLYVYVAVTAIGTLFWGIKTVGQYSG